jgi:diguanylate cyclase
LALARAAIDDLVSHGAPTSPPNYEIWISHLAGANPELSHEIETRLKRGEQLSDQFSEELFERFFARSRLSSQMIEASASIARELDEVLSSLRGAGSQARSYAGELEGAAKGLENSADPEALQRIVTELALATRQMAEHNQRLEAQMETSCRQVEALQSTLTAVRIEALTDGLTGLANRRHFDEAIQSKILEASENQTDLCLVLCDIDHFKRINDTWGHQVGDHVIRFVAQHLKSSGKRDEISARYGGEEFSLLLPRTSLGEAEAFAERTRRAISNRKLSRRSTGEIIGQITVSFGVASYKSGETAADLIARADRCLYASKQSGRDRVTVETALALASAA